MDDMMTIRLLKNLLADRKINQQQFRTYMGQVKHGDEIHCIIGLQRKHLIDNEKAEEMITHIKLAYTE